MLLDYPRTVAPAGLNRTEIPTRATMASTRTVPARALILPLMERNYIDGQAKGVLTLIVVARLESPKLR